MRRLHPGFGGGKSHPVPRCHLLRCTQMGCSKEPTSALCMRRGLPRAQPYTGPGWLGADSASSLLRGWDLARGHGELDRGRS